MIKGLFFAVVIFLVGTFPRRGCSCSSWVTSTPTCRTGARCRWARSSRSYSGGSPRSSSDRVRRRRGEGLVVGDLKTNEERRAEGRARRVDVPRSSHAGWVAPSNRPDPVALLEERHRARVHDLVPIRVGRMLVSPFTFLRGAAEVMAHDLAGTPTTGLRVQACGDAHLLNFGVFATPERHLVFDVNDFDETLPGPWEWDVKRLATSIAVAALRLGEKPGLGDDAVGDHGGGLPVPHGGAGGDGPARRVVRADRRRRGAGDRRASRRRRRSAPSSA